MLASSGKAVLFTDADLSTPLEELEKLVAWAGDRKVIRAEDVDALVVRTAEDPFFALGNAVESRDAAEALAVLRRSLADGSNGAMLLGSLAGTIRRLVVERERGRLAAPGRRIASFQEWQALVLPSIDAEELGKRKPYGFWMKYQAAMRFGREELLEALPALAEADHAMKTGADAGLLLEVAIPVALKRAQPGTREFRAALRDALEGVRDLAAAHGVFNPSPADHQGFDTRARVMVQIKDGAWRLVK